MSTYLVRIGSLKQKSQGICYKFPVNIKEVFKWQITARCRRKCSTGNILKPSDCRDAEIMLLQTQKQCCVHRFRGTNNHVCGSSAWLQLRTLETIAQKKHKTKSTWGSWVPGHGLRLCTRLRQALTDQQNPHTPIFRIGARVRVRVIVFIT